MCPHEFPLTPQPWIILRAPPEVVRLHHPSTMEPMRAPTIDDETRGRRAGRVASLLGFLAIALQRFGISAGENTSVQLTTLVLLATVLWALFVIRVPARPANIFLYCAIVATVCGSAILSFSAGTTASIASLLLMVITYALVLVAGGGRASRLGNHFFGGAVAAIQVGAALAVVQAVWQRLGRGYLDPLLAVPNTFLVSGYNTYWDLRFQGGAGQFKPNGVIFLEPALLSLYTAIGIVYILSRLFGAQSGGGRRSNVIWLLVLIGGFAVSASASGVVVLALAAAPLVFTIRRNRGLVLIVAAALVVAAASGAFNSIIAKAMEGFTGTTSAALRLTLPYEYLLPRWAERPIFGWGPGEAGRLIAETQVQYGLQASTLMKLLVEYGLVGASILGLILVVCLRGSQAPLPLAVAVFAAWAIPAEALLNSSLVLLLLFALPNWRRTFSGATQPHTGQDTSLGRPALRRASALG